MFKLKFGRMIANLVVHLSQFAVWQKHQHSSRCGFPKFVVLISFESQCRSIEIINDPRFIIFSCLDTVFRIKDPKLVKTKSFEMNVLKTYRGQAFMLDG